MTPFVSVIIPTRDRPDMLREALDSVRAQTFTNYEIIVVINGPENPLTPKIVDVAAGCNLVRIEQAGIAIALNTGIKAAKGEWLAFLDDDDLWEPNKLGVKLGMAQSAGADLIFCNTIKFDETSRTPDPPLRPPHPFSASEVMTVKNYGTGCSATMAKRVAVLAVGGFDESMVSPDWDLWMRLAWRYRVEWVDDYLVLVRLHPENTSKQISWFYWTLYIQYKALKTLPPNLRHMRPRLLFQMLKVAIKGVEKYVRLNYLQPLKRALAGWKVSLRRAPPTA